MSVAGAEAAGFVTVFTSQAGEWTPGFGTEEATLALTWTRSIEWDTDDWRQTAACRDTDPDLFFPIGTTGQAIDQIDAARSVCFACDVREACLEFALATNQESGVWGGTSEEERRKLRKAWLAARRRRSA
jgi:WhiB family redox-sensing transcriptional regulator